MARVLQLTDNSTGTVNLIDKVNYDVREGGILLSMPEIKAVWSGDNPSRDGADLTRLTYGNRDVRFRVALKGATHDALATAIVGLNTMLVKAQDAQLRGWGSPVVLNYKWTDASGTMQFDVLTGRLDLSPDFQSIQLEKDKWIINNDLTLICRPFACGTVSGSHENWIDNPSFEEGATAPGDSWTKENSGDVTATWDTTNCKYGLRSLQLACLPDGANNTGVQSDDIIVGTAAAARTGYLKGWGRHVAGDPLTLRLWDDASDDWLTAAAGMKFSGGGATWAAVGCPVTIPGTCGTVEVHCHIGIADSSAGGTCQIDGLYFNLSGGSPDFWISSRNIVNHIDSDADHVNYFDIEDVPGEQPAGLRIGGISGELAQRVRQTPSNYGYNYDSTDATFGTNVSVYSHANYQGGSAAQIPDATQAAWANLVSWTVNTNMIHKYGRVRVFVAYGNNKADANTMDMRAILAYGNDTKNGRTIHISSTTANGRLWADAGIFTLPPQAFIPRDGEVNQWIWRIQYSAFVGSASPPYIDNQFVIDCIYVVPLDGYALEDGHDVLDSTKDPPSAYKLVTRSDDTSDYSMAITSGFVGDVPSAVPNRQNRFYFRANTGTAGSADIMLGGSVRAQIRPRYLYVR